jgi:hypothetical protein
MELLNEKLGKILTAQEVAQYLQGRCETGEGALYPYLVECARNGS